MCVVCESKRISGWGITGDRAFSFSGERERKRKGRKKREKGGGSDRRLVVGAQADHPDCLRQRDVTTRYLISF